ncbi:hypothetical protein RIF29_16814 [Crotalaria pallida]|uniref:Mei2-like C-terminal RNA recognition motif domain-containing protein n=1 Tax=Crotalaria pallida TaxID=3830 RepID=A0AAN9IDY5_CROPI
MALNPNAEPFYYEPRKISSFISQPYLLYHGFRNPPFYPPHSHFSPTQYHVSGATAHFKRIPVSTNKNIIRCHQKLPMGNGMKRVANKYEWRVKGTTKEKKLEEQTREQQKLSAPVRNAIPFPTTIEEAQASNFTTLMIRNIPNQFKFYDLLEILDDHCLKQNKTSVDDSAHYSKYDFVYLPMDYRKHAIEKQFSNLGYAFVNFTTPLAAYKFYKEFHGFVWNVTKNKKTCQINKAQCQGKEALINKFNQKVFRCKSTEFLPVEFPEARDGWNRKSGGITVGEHVWGLPRRSIGS